MGAGSVIEKLPRIVMILRSSKPTDVKFKEIQEAGLSAVNSETFSSLVSSFSASAQLGKRLEELVKSSALGLPHEGEAGCKAAE